MCTIIAATSIAQATINNKGSRSLSRRHPHILQITISLFEGVSILIVQHGHHSPSAQRRTFHVPGRFFQPRMLLRLHRCYPVLGVFHETPLDEVTTQWRHASPRLWYRNSTTNTHGNKNKATDGAYKVRLLASFRICRQAAMGSP